MLFSGSLGTVLVFLIYASWTVKQHIFGTNIQIAYQCTDGIPKICTNPKMILQFQKSLHRSVNIIYDGRNMVWGSSGQWRTRTYGLQDPSSCLPVEVHFG